MRISLHVYFVYFFLVDDWISNKKPEKERGSRFPSFPSFLLLLCSFFLCVRESVETNDSQRVCRPASDLTFCIPTRTHISLVALCSLLFSATMAALKMVIAFAVLVLLSVQASAYDREWTLLPRSWWRSSECDCLHTHDTVVDNASFSCPICFG